MLGNNIYYSIFLLLIFTACAAQDAELYSADTAGQNTVASEAAEENETESLEKELEKERKARLEAESQLEEIRREQYKTNQDVEEEPAKDDATEIIKPPKTKPEVDIAAEYNKVVDAYVAYLNGLTLNEENQACSSDADLSELNQMQRAALRDACSTVGYREVIAKPKYPQRRQNPESEPQPEYEDTVDSLIKIFDAVMRGVGR